MVLAKYFLLQIDGLVTTNAANLSLTFQWYYYNTSIQARTLDKAFIVRAHYKHAAIFKVFTAACQHLAWNIDTFVKCQLTAFAEEDLSMKNIEQRTGYGAK